MSIFSIATRLIHTKRTKTLPIVIASCATLMIGACSTAHQNNDIAHIHDPYEGYNRKIMAFNQQADKIIIHPTIRGYRTIVPQPARNGVHNVLVNLRSPLTLTNQVLQGDWDGAHDVVLRAIINSLLGIGGVFDIAGYEGIKYEPEDFGQTLAVWGVDSGPYVVVPFLGPSSSRDYLGYFADYAMDPVRWVAFNADAELLYSARFAGDYLDIRDSLMDTLVDTEQSSFDYYAAIRSIYYQHRQALIEDRVGSLEASFPDIPDYDD